MISKSVSFWEDKRVFLVVVLSILLLLNSVENVQAYIGPGAGFAFLSSFLIIFIAFALAIFYILSWPFRFSIRARFLRRPRNKSEIKRVILIGLDGMDPKLSEKYINEGKLPNFQKLKESLNYEEQELDKVIQNLLKEGEIYEVKNKYMLLK